MVSRYCCRRRRCCFRRNGHRVVQAVFHVDEGDAAVVPCVAWPLRSMQMDSNARMCCLHMQPTLPWANTLEPIEIIKSDRASTKDSCVVRQKSRPIQQRVRKLAQPHPRVFANRMLPLAQWTVQLLESLMHARTTASQVKSSHSKSVLFGVLTAKSSQVNRKSSQVIRADDH
jgi:hypothetical protein